MVTAPSHAAPNLLDAILDGPADQLLLVGGGRRWSREELRETVERRAADMAERGLRAGAVHVLDGVPDVETVLELLAVWRLDAVAGLLSPGLTSREWTAAVETLATASDVPAGTAAVLWTSGTAGRPRGVALGHRNLVASALAARDRLSLGGDDVWLASLSPAHVGGLALVTRSLLLSSTLLAPGPIRAEALPPLLRGSASAPPVSHLSLVPTQLLRLLDAWGDALPPRTLRLVLVGGAHAPARLVERALASAWPVSLTYGMTEMTSQVATAAPAEVLYDPESVGRPLDGVEVRVAGSGELLVRGPTLALGYVGGREALADPEGWYHTGDLGALDARGRLRVTGRRADRIVSGGVTVDAREVEEVLRDHPAVAAAAVAGVPDPEWGERVGAAVVLREREGDAAPDPDAVLESLDDWCRERLGPARIPRIWVTLPELPLNRNGKVDRAAVREALV
ncbi:MAG TPA: AMP-binding protein [Longimicrobiales bacterium]|nr:AMP-binding protein [Longimicrobiales bacterium]